MYKNMRKRSNILLHGVVHAVDQGNDAHQQEQPLPCECECDEFIGYIVTRCLIPDCVQDLAPLLWCILMLSPVSLNEHLVTVMMAQMLGENIIKCFNT